ncbi:MAG TPA: rod shape-determining protein RodA [Candidatus Dormibacteraeota bacterium]
MIRERWYHRWDPLQLLLAAALATLGLMTLYSTSRTAFGSQLAGLALGAAAFTALAVFDYRRLRPAAPWLYAAALLLLLAVAVAGHSALGAQRWIRLAGVQLEPSEVAKLLALIALAAYLAGRERLHRRDVLVVLGLSAAPVALVLRQPDLGTAIVFVVLALGLLFLAGAPRLPLAAIAVGGVAAIPLLPHLLHGYQRRRLEIFLNPGQDPLGAGYNLIQARIAIGSGGLFGQGWMHGLQGSLGYVPERSSDFVFAVYAEQFGLAGCLLLLGLFGLLLMRLLRASTLAPDRFGELLCLGAAVVFFTQVFQNIGMNLGLTPIAGIPLPFLSHGSSALVTELAMLGLVQSVLLRRSARVGDRTLVAGFRIA